MNGLPIAAKPAKVQWPVCFESLAQNCDGNPQLAKINNEVHQSLAPARQVVRAVASKLKTGWQYPESQNPE